MIKLLIIADDFTGALDTGVQFSKKGIPTLVTVKTDIDLNRMDADLEVLVVDIESRHMDKNQAAQRVKEITRWVRTFGVEYIYKKTDSTLRGNVGAELTALMHECHNCELMFIPAFPKTNRTTIKGYQYVNGLLLQESVFAKDPFEPVKNSYIPDIIKMQSDVNVSVIDYKKINHSNDFSSVFQMHSDESTIYVFDAEKDEDLKNIGQFLKDQNKLKVTAGCAGFAEFLPELLGLTPKPVKIKKNKANTLVVSGSINEIAISQINYAEQQGYKSFTLTPAQKLEKHYLETLEGEEFIEEVIKKINNEELLILKTVDSRDDIQKCIGYAQKISMNQEKMHLKIAENVGRIVKNILNETMIGTVVVFGGDTVLGIMKAIEAQGLMPKREIVPGVVVSTVMSDAYKIDMITKAGGFGDEDVLIKIKDYLKEGE
ncbi:MAG: D-threonate/D-erythronate kinase [Clostridiales bacterium]|jgi:uncharacterized protein YgbK (DUF1537 family)|nr:D-threonate/D-erythronate kinase [Clostridiales bacterium]MDK2934564.1 D-threonate/D-erythronate kinase [Clostridiales bacterium]